MHVRRFRTEDLDPIIALFRDTVRTVNLRDYTESQVAAWAPDRIDPERWEDRLNRNTSLAAVDDDGTVVGFTELTREGVVLMMFVHQHHQRQGIGTALLGALEHESGGMHMTELKTEASITAVPFFQAHGFEIYAEQNLHIGGEAFRNYDMRKRL